MSMVFADSILPSSHTLISLSVELTPPPATTPTPPQRKRVRPAASSLFLKKKLKKHELNLHF